ncbi:hypothetical protein ACFHWW_26525 [Ensifer sp. P24N7]|uniref:hypothetical protein n=1 Tax=Sinorhizobium sp. P24N7 TaxID=3348358 RepID=UPI0035F375EA
MLAETVEWAAAMLVFNWLLAQPQSANPLENRVIFLVGVRRDAGCGTKRNTIARISFVAHAAA